MFSFQSGSQVLLWARGTFRWGFTDLKHVGDLNPHPSDACIFSLSDGEFGSVVPVQIFFFT